MRRAQGPGGSDGGAVGASGRNDNSGRQSEREGHASKNLASKKKMQSNNWWNYKKKDINQERDVAGDFNTPLSETDGANAHTYDKEIY